MNTKAIRIAIDIPFDASAHMGTGVYSQTALERLAETSPECKIIALTNKRLTAELETSYSNLQILNSDKDEDVGYDEVTRRILRDFNPSVWFAPGTLIPDWYEGVSVATIHDLAFLEHAEWYHEQLARSLSDGVRISIAKASHLIAISEETRQSIQKHFCVPNEKISVLHQPVRRLFETPMPPDEIVSRLNSLGVHSTPFYFHVSNLAPHKNIRFAIEVFAAFSRKFPGSGHCLVVAGGGLSPSKQDDPIEIARRYNIVNRIKFVGRVSDLDLKALYSACHAFLFPSLFEGWGLPIAEAVACGAHVLCPPLPAAKHLGLTSLSRNPSEWVDAMQTVPIGTRKVLDHDFGEQLKAILTQAVELSEVSAVHRISVPSPPSLLSIVIPTFDNIPCLRLLLESIDRSTGAKYPVIVVSDGCSDGTVEFVNSRSNTILVHLSENRGICTATNAGVEASASEYIFILNDDMVLPIGWDATLLRHLGQRNVVCPTLIEPGIVPVARRFHTANCGVDPREFDWKGFERCVSDLAEPKTEDSVNYPILVSRALWDKVGGLDENFDPGPVSDVDLFYRMAFAGAQFLQDRSSLIYHFSGVAFRRRRPELWRAAEEANLTKFFTKWQETPNFSMGGAVRPGESARLSLQTRQQSPTLLGSKRESPRISVHIISRETDALGVDFLRTCLSSVRGYADEVVIVDNGNCEMARECIHEMKNDLSLKVIPADGVRCFSDLRNMAIKATSMGMTHVHKIDTDEAYLPTQLLQLKEFLFRQPQTIIQCKLVHFMIEPTLIESIHEKPVVFPFRADLAWSGSVHETVNPLNAKVQTVDCSFLHFGYCRPQWQTLLKWLRYAQVDGGLTHYMFEYVDGVRLPWFRNGRHPNNVLETRRTRLIPYRGAYPEGARAWLEDFGASQIAWSEWVEKRTASSLWPYWLQLKQALGTWEATIEPILAHGLDHGVSS